MVNFDTIVLSTLYHTHSQFFSPRWTILGLIKFVIVLFHFNLFLLFHFDLYRNEPVLLSFALLSLHHENLHQSCQATDSLKRKKILGVAALLTDWS